MKSFTFVAFAALAVLVHQTSAQNDVNVEVESNNGGSATGGRRVRTLTLDENGAQYSRQGRHSNLDATLGADGVQINRNGRNILDGRTADFGVTEDGTANMNLQGRRAHLEANAGNRNNIDYSRKVRQGETADGSGVKRASVDLDNGTVNIVGRRVTAKANDDEMSYTRRVKRGSVADGGDTKRANIDLNTGKVDVVGRKTKITGRIGGTGEDALKIQRIGRTPEERAQRRQDRQEWREERQERKAERRSGRRRASASASPQQS